MFKKHLLNRRFAQKKKAVLKKQLLGKNDCSEKVAAPKNSLLWRAEQLPCKRNCSKIANLKKYLLRRGTYYEEVTSQLS